MFLPSGSEWLVLLFVVLLPLLFCSLLVFHIIKWLRRH